MPKIARQCSRQAAQINADAVTGAKIADNAIDSDHYTDGSIDIEHLNGLANNSSGFIQADGSGGFSTGTAKIEDDQLDE